VHELLTRRGVHVPYSSLHRFAIKHCGFAERRRITVRMAECEPGKIAEVDFGRLGHIPDPKSGRKRLLWALVVVLVSSRHQYVHVTHSQKVPDLIDGLEDAWEAFGGTPRRVIIDYVVCHIIRILCPVPLMGAKDAGRAGRAGVCGPYRAHNAMTEHD
jgi:transposase